VRRGISTCVIRKDRLTAANLIFEKDSKKDGINKKYEIDDPKLLIRFLYRKFATVSNLVVRVFLRLLVPRIAKLKALTPLHNLSKALNLNLIKPRII
jgi:hypothetical protein